MKRYLVFGAVGIVVLLLALVALALPGLSDMELSNAKVSNLTFSSGGATLAGTLALPVNVEKAPVVLIIHGDGPTDRFSEDGYLPFFNTLLDAGIGVFSWDKRGIGESSGNWLDQSMSDRATEALAALALVRSQNGVAADKVGFLGFSQGGWVIPKAASEGDPDFSVIIGGAVNWRRQGIYYTKLRLANEGKTPTEIDEIVSKEVAENDRIFGGTQAGQKPADMDRARFDFVMRNYLEDVTPALKTMKGPVLAVWGKLDLNVDAAADSSVYREVFAGAKDRRVVVIADGTHQLLRAGLFNYQLQGEWPAWKELLFVAMGRRAYAPGALDLITDWIKTTTSASEPVTN